MVRQRRTTLHIDSLPDAQLGDEGTIALDVLLLQVVQQTAALADHLQQAAVGVLVLGLFRMCSVSTLIRSVRMATWTSGEPVSPSWVRLASMIAVFCSLRSMKISTFLHIYPQGLRPGIGESPRSEGLGPHIHVLLHDTTEIPSCKDKNVEFSPDRRKIPRFCPRMGLTNRFFP